MPLNRVDALRTLGLASDYSESELRRAYRDLVQVWHPDRFTDQRLKQRAEEELKRINEAYAVLTSRPPAENAPRVRRAGHSGQGFSRISFSGTHRTEASVFAFARRPRFNRRWPSPRWLPGSKVLLLAALAAAPVVLGWYIYDAIRPSVLTLNSALGGDVRLPPAQSRLLYPSLAVNPVADLTSAAENLQTWALMRWLELRQTKLVAVPADPAPPEARTLTVSPRLRPESPTRPATGHLFHPGPPYGAGQLEMTNLTALDAAVQLVALDRPRKLARHIYLRAGDSFAVRDLSPRQYIMHAELGQGWLARRASFATPHRRLQPIGPISYVQFQSARQTWSDLVRVEIRSDGRP